MKKIILGLLLLSSTFLCKSQEKVSVWNNSLGFNFQDTIYIDVDASDNGDGTFEFPYNHINHVSRVTGGESRLLLQENTFYLFKRGTTIDLEPEHKRLEIRNGSSVGAYGYGDNPTFVFNDRSQFVMGQWYQNNTGIRDVNFVSTDTLSYGIHGHYGRDFYISNVNSYGSGISAYRTGGLIFIDSCKIRKTETEGIFINGDGYLDSIYIWNSHLDSINTNAIWYPGDQNISDGDGIQIYAPFQWIKNTTVDKRGTGTKFCFINFCRDKLIIENSRFLMDLNVYDGHLFHVDGHPSVDTDTLIIRNNYFYGGQNQAWLHGGYYYLYNNIFVGASLNAINVGGQGIMCNNTIIDANNGIRATSRWRIYNNNLYNCNTNYRNVSTLMRDYNNAYPNRLFGEPNSLNVNPNFIKSDDTYKLDSTSQLINSGNSNIVLLAGFNKDYFGNSFDLLSPSIGHYQYNKGDIIDPVDEPINIYTKPYFIITDVNDNRLIIKH